MASDGARDGLTSCWTGRVGITVAEVRAEVEATGRDGEVRFGADIDVCAPGER